MTPTGHTLLFGLLFDMNLPCVALTKTPRSSPWGLVTESFPTRLRSVFMCVDSVPLAGTVHTGLVAAQDETAKTVIPTSSAASTAVSESKRRFTGPPRRD